jgi:ABC-type nitrate/sulfonate/bicarbonate transport system permease component
LRLVALPASLPWLFAAARLAVPRALLGVMIAEWLATGRGLGNLLNQSRGYLDYGMIWTVALVSVLASVALYQLAVTLERMANRE